MRESEFVHIILYSQGIDIINKKSESKEYNICHYWTFLHRGFTFQPNVSNRCLDLLMMSMNLSDIAIIDIKSVNYYCIISRISKNDAINLMENVDLTKKVEYDKS